MEAYILLEVAPKKVKSVVTAVKRVKGVECAQAVVGPYDVIVYVETKDIKSLGSLVVGKIQSIDGVQRTLTCIAVEL